MTQRVKGSKGFARSLRIGPFKRPCSQYEPNASLYLLWIRGQISRREYAKHEGSLQKRFEPGHAFTTDIIFNSEGAENARNAAFVLSDYDS